jgi:SAM-dependent methyltransferase
MNNYQPSKFWENTHADVNDELVRGGRGIRSVGGGASAVEADYLYRLRRRAFQSALQTAKETVPSCGNLKIFEFGCGSGYWLTQLPALLGHSGFSYTGADISPTAIRRLQSNYPDSTFVCLDDISQSWARIESGAPFNLTLAIDVLYHITDDTIWRDTFRRLVRLTSADGFFIFSDYGFAQAQEHAIKIHVKHRPLQMYLDELDQLDMSVVAIAPKFYFFNRIKYGPWKDHSRLTAAIWRLADSFPIVMHLLYMLDSQLIRVIRPMNPRCKARFFVCRRLEGTVDRLNNFV